MAMSMPFARTKADGSRNPRTHSPRLALFQTAKDATGLPRGTSRSQLHQMRTKPWIPRPCAVDAHVLEANGNERETPRSKHVASGGTFYLSCSCERENTTGQARDIFLFLRQIRRQSHFTTAVLVISLTTSACGLKNQGTSSLPAEVETTIATVSDDLEWERYEKIYNESSSLWKREATLECPS